MPRIPPMQELNMKEEKRLSGSFAESPRSSVSLSPQLSPWDLSGATFDFGLYRPRRPSYLYATKRRASSLRSVHDDNDSSDNHADKKRRTESYKRANRHEDRGTVTEENTTDKSQTHVSDNHLPVDKPKLHQCNSITIALNDKPIESIDTTNSPYRTKASPPPVVTRSAYRRNMFVLCLSFVLIFTVFRSIQNLQSSMNNENKLGIIAMCVTYMVMFISCPMIPCLNERLGTKWSIVLGMLFYHFWIAANLYPHYITLMPTSIGVGIGQSMAWTGQVTYMSQITAEYTASTAASTEYDIYRFNGIFLAFFQTTHIWGNLVSSLMLKVVRPNSTVDHVSGNRTVLTTPVAGLVKEPQLCGVWDECRTELSDISRGFVRNFDLASSSVFRLMLAHLCLASVGFLLLVTCLKRIDKERKSPHTLRQVVGRNLSRMVKDKMFRLLIPLLLFNGFEQGFLYADFNKSFVTCPLGIEYIGYTMITLGATNVLSSLGVGVAARHMPREVIVGIACIMHIGLMIFLLIFIPTQEHSPFIFASAAVWGICDAVWQTQCNVLIGLACPEDHDVAFNNFRVLQALGAGLAFGLGTCLCIATKMYILISLLVAAMMPYALLEHHLKAVYEEEDEFPDVLHVQVPALVPNDMRTIHVLKHDQSLHSIHSIHSLHNIVDTVSAPLHHNTAPVPHNTAPVPHNTAPVPHNTAPVPHNMAPVPHNMAPVPLNHNIVDPSPVMYNVVDNE